MTGLAALAGFLVMGGIWLTVTSWSPVAPTPSSGLGRIARIDPMHLATAVGGGLLGLVVTRWPVGALGGAVGGWLAAGWWHRRSTRRPDGRGEAVALWAEMLRDALGTSRGIEGVLAATAQAAPVAIRPEVQQAARRLRSEPLDVVLHGLAHDLADPVGDLVVVALRLTAQTGGSQLRDVLADLAAAAYGQADAQRRVSIARERPRAAMRYTAAVIGGFLVLLMLFSRSYLAPYNTVGGQAVLIFVAGYWGVGLWWMSRMSQATPAVRVLRPADQRGAQ